MQLPNGDTLAAFWYREDCIYDVCLRIRVRQELEMELDRKRFLSEEYLILREIVPPPQLESLRAVSELMVEWQKAI